MWNCEVCTYENPPLRQICSMCETPRSSAPPPPPPPVLPVVTPPTAVPVAAQPQPRHFVVTIPAGVGPGMRFRATHPTSGLFEVQVPDRYHPGMQLQVALPSGGQQHQQMVPAEPPPTLPWVCSRCTLENAGAATACAACEGPRPREAEMTEEEQLAHALALSATMTGGAPPDLSDAANGPGGGVRTAGVAQRWSAAGYSDAPAGAPQQSEMRALSDEAAALLAAQSNVAAGLRHDPLVSAAALRVAGDARGTASALVGLTKEEELELAMLKSKVAFEHPETNATPPRDGRAAHAPPAYASAVGGGGGDGGYPSLAAHMSDPSAPLPSLTPLVAPVRAPARKPAGAGGTLREGLLGGQGHEEALRQPPTPLGGRPLAGARKQRTPPTYTSNYQPPTVPVPAAPPVPPVVPMAPVAPQEAVPLAPAISGYEDDETPPFANWVEDASEWDDADRPLRAVPLARDDAPPPSSPAQQVPLTRGQPSGGQLRTEEPLLIDLPHAQPPSPDNPRQGLLAADRTAQEDAYVRRGVGGGAAARSGYANLMD